MRFREPAICLRAIDYSETSQIVTFLTRGEGVLRIMAKGTKRPKSKSGGMIDLLAEGDLVASMSDRNPDSLGTLMEFSETASHRAVRHDARTLNAALYMLELTRSLLGEGDPHPEVYDLLARSLGRLGEPDAPVPAVLAWFQWRLLRHAGLLGGLAECVGCGLAVEEMVHQERQRVRFSSAHGGLLCDGCEGGATDTIAISDATLGALAALSAAEAGRKINLPDAQAVAVNRLLAYHVTHQIGRPLRMARHAVGYDARPSGPR
jgi:DNA repair protein RecO (recombination protein O)